MPITPLHFGLLAPVNHFFPSKVSNVGFVLMNVLIDLPVVHHVMYQKAMDLPIHSPVTHSFMGVMVCALVVSLFGFKSMKWGLGVWLGAVSHVLMDALVHSDMHPFYPSEGNPLCLIGVTPLSILALPLLAWWILQVLDAEKAKNHLS